MKIVFIHIFISWLAFACFAQEQSANWKIPSVDLKNTEGKKINTSQINNNGKPVIIIFWKICCKLPEKQLDAISEVYEKWKNETGVKILAVSIDDSKTTNKVNPFVNGKGWDYEILLDPNSDFKRAMNVNAVPHTFLINGKGEIVWQKPLFNNGDENVIYDEIKKIIN